MRIMVQSQQLEIQKPKPLQVISEVTLVRASKLS